MSIIYKTAAGKAQIIEFCQIAKTHRLCIPGWNLICDLNSVVNGYTDPIEVEISLAYDGDKPIAIALKYHKVVQCFVRAAYRRKGIGSEVIKPHMDKNVRTLSGTVHSKSFWRKNGVGVSYQRMV
jgi:GNAT superfamily N-acetyltransferase